MANPIPFKGTIAALSICCSGLLLFNWPLLDIPSHRAGLSTFLFLFVVWLVLIFLLYAYARKESQNNTTDDPHDTDGT
ncbi:MAG: hypothetical protein KKB70_11840 [Proteobacteria bacterium]|nr:hypothetical protein [Pseudomonadota bacterium]MBU1611813.1 hypothetical protein [Pseudomonadota bacterium]